MVTSTWASTTSWPLSRAPSARPSSSIEPDGCLNTCASSAFTPSAGQESIHPETAAACRWKRFLTSSCFLDSCPSSQSSHWTISPCGESANQSNGASTSARCALQTRSQNGARTQFSRHVPIGRGRPQSRRRMAASRMCHCRAQSSSGAKARRDAPSTAFSQVGQSRKSC